MSGAKLPQTELMDTAEIAKVPNETAMSIDQDEAAHQDNLDEEQQHDADNNEQVLS